MNWITDDWRLKLLAFGLAVLMLGAVAFSQNPPTSKTLSKGIDYTVPPELMLINPPARTTVTVTGLADTIVSVTAQSVVATVDLTKASPGKSVNVNLVVRSLVLGATVQNPVVPEALDIEQRVVVSLPVVVRTPRVTPGWEVTRAEARCPTAPCSVTFDGPLSMEPNLKAYADYTNPVQNPSDDLLTQQVMLVQNGVPLDLTKLVASTLPPASLVPNVVNVHVEAKTGIASRQAVLVDAQPSNPPPACYRVTNVSIDPITVIVTGSPDVLGKITTLTLPAVDLSRSTSNVTFKVTINYPDGVSGATASARVTYSIWQNPNCTAPSP